MDGAALSVLKLNWGGLLGSFTSEQETGQWMGFGGWIVNKLKTEQSGHL